MILDLSRFIAEERPFWRELEGVLDAFEAAPNSRLPLEEVKRFHYLYERAAADLAKIRTFAAEPSIHRYLETLVARAYGEIQENHGKGGWRAAIHWLFVAFPAVFRKHIGAFWVASGLMCLGALLGAGTIALDPDPAVKQVIVGPFEHLLGDPSERVAKEEAHSETDVMAGSRSQFAAQLMTHNTRVAILTLASGMTFGTLTFVLLFFNGVILGGVCMDYVMAGEGQFLTGWLLPHGSFEIPAIIIAGQAGLVLGKTLLSRSRRESMRRRLRAVRGDLTTLICGVGVMLIWAGIVESFFSQNHEPFVQYEVKIAFGVVELLLLATFLAFAGRRRKAPASAPGPAAA